MKKININVGAVIDLKAVSIPESTDYLKDDEVYWRLGTGCIGGRELAIERKKCLDGYEFRLGGQMLNPKDIESWYAREYIEWRDG